MEHHWVLDYSKRVLRASPSRSIVIYFSSEEVGLEGSGVIPNLQRGAGTCAILCAIPELPSPALWHCPRDPVTMLTKPPEVVRAECRPVQRPAVPNAAVCPSQRRLHWCSMDLGLLCEPGLCSCNGPPCSWSWSSSLLSGATSWWYWPCRWSGSCRTPPTTSWCHLRLPTCW